MLVLVVLTFLGTVAAVPDEMQELANMLHQQCQSETGVPENLIVDARVGKFADDNTLKCYIKCLMDQMAVLEDDGTIDIEGVIAILPDGPTKEKGVKVIRDCGQIPGSDDCDMSWKVHKCWQAGGPDVYFLP